LKNSTTINSIVYIVPGVANGGAGGNAHAGAIGGIQSNGYGGGGGGSYNGGSSTGKHARRRHRRTWEGNYDKIIKCKYIVYVGLIY